MSVKSKSSQASHFASNKVSLYHQLATILREQILSGQYSPNDQLPTETELVAEYGVSRITVRQALRNLPFHFKNHSLAGYHLRSNL